MGAPTVPYPFDVVIDSLGYVFYDGEEQKGAFSLSPVYIPRQNTQGDYGDNQQDFWLTWSQKDWSKGEGQRFQGRDDDGKSRYFYGVTLDGTIPGEITARKSVTSLTFAAAPVSAVPSVKNDTVYVSTSTTLYHVDYAGTITSDGAHGLGAAPSRWGMAWDGNNVFLSTTTAGTVGVRKFISAAFTTFSATGSDALAYLNNTLYGYSESSTSLIRYDSAGAATTLFTWKDSAGGGESGSLTKLLPFGGKLLILRPRLSGSRGAELWVYDGTGVSRVAEFPSNFNAYDCEVLNGAVLVTGGFEKHVGATVNQKPAVFFYKDGTQDVLWQGRDYVASSTAQPAVALYQQGAVWTEAIDSRILFYDAVSGGVSGLANLNPSPVSAILCAAATFVLYGVTGSTTGRVFPGATTGAGQVYSSLVDFDTTLRKQFRGIRVEFDAATDGDGGSVDIAYRYDNIDTSLTYTSLQTGAVSGTEYAIPANSPGVSNNSISVSVTLNKGTSTNGPKLKRVQVRAIPVTPAFKKRQYVLYLAGRDGEGHVKLRDDSVHGLDGKDMATNLQTSAAKPVQYSITDHLGTYTGVIESLNMVEFKPEQWIATVSCREV